MTEKYQPTNPGFAVYGWEQQAPQYAATGEPGVSFETNEVPGVTMVNCLLWRDSGGVLRAILNHFPRNVQLHGRQVEKAGNVNIYVDPGWHRRRLGTLLLDEANARWGPINLDQQEFTPAGALFARRYQAAELVPVTELRENDMVDLTGDPYADPGHGTEGHDCRFPDGADLTVVGGEDGPGKLESPTCYRLDHWHGAHGFPPEHKLRKMGVHTPTLPDALHTPAAGTPIHDAVTTTITTEAPA
jgi:GNAT superfamily N-acetyltransferase